MEFLPRLLASKFDSLKETSTIKLFAMFFGAFALIFVVSSVGDFAAKFVFPILVGVLFVFFSGVVSAQHFARKPFVSYHPIFVQLSATKWFNSLASALSVIRNYFVLVIIHLIVFVAILAILSPLVLWYGS